LQGDYIARSKELYEGYGAERSNLAYGYALRTP